MSYTRKVKNLKAKKKKFVYQKIMRSQGYHDPNIFDLIKNTFCSMTFIEKPISGGVKFVVSFLHCIVLFITLLSVYSVYLASKANLMSEENSRISLAFDTTKPGQLRKDAIQWMLDEGMDISNLVFNDFESHNMQSSKLYINKMKGIHKIWNLIIDDSSLSFYTVNTEFSDLMIRDSSVDFFSERASVSLSLLEDSEVTISGANKNPVNHISIGCLVNSKVTIKDSYRFIFMMTARARSEFREGMYNFTKPNHECVGGGSMHISDSSRVSINGSHISRVVILDSKNIRINFELGWEVERDKGGRIDTYNFKTVYFRNGDDSKVYTSRHVNFELVNSQIVVNGEVFDKYSTEAFPFLSIKNSQLKTDEIKGTSQVSLSGDFAIIEADINKIDLNTENENTFVGMLVIRNGTSELCKKVGFTAKELGVRLDDVTFVGDKPCTFGMKVSDEAWEFSSKEISHQHFIEGMTISRERLLAQMKKLFDTQL
ncbi:hypothetical protein PCIT_a3088 [Pseudoalteromonas citrea]|uniref:Uncharacterized protein n=2 Tax=Pseudoalteromonas citrea TaxID=43655 RepID=A0AAD4FRP9_9GAMM|nr:hypothetical protein [Pseudoalteromonas citrea]KAF7770124.1 hypothetical protein PCIT_a3088 [Pseudoalteromonas citrea]